MAIWLSKHAAWIAAKDEIFEGDAKKAHTCLRRAAGILIFVQENAGIFSLKNYLKHFFNKQGILIAVV